MIPKRVAIIGSTYPSYERYCPNWNGMKSGLDRLFVNYKFFSVRPNIDVDAIVEYQPDFILYGLIEILYNKQACERIRTECPNAKIVFWYGDMRNETTGYHRGDYSKLIDEMYVSNDSQSDFWKRALKIKKVSFLPLGCEPLDVPLYNRNLDFDFVFVGGINGKTAFFHRSMLINYLIDYHGLKIINSYENEMRKRIFKAMPMIYSSSKTCLDISHFTDVKGYTSNRFWNIPAFYGFALTKRWPGCEEYYPKETRAYFDTVEELLDLLKYYLFHEEQRRQMVEKAHKLSYNHTYDKRFLIMFKDYE